MEEALSRFLQGFLAALPGTPDLAVADLARALAAQPQRVAALQERYAQAWAAMWARAGSATPQSEPPAEVDRRFESADWDEVPFFRLVRDAYLLNAQCLQELIELAGLPAERARRVRFVARQVLDALAPSNFPWTNPEALRLAAQTRGASVEDGLRNLTADLAQGAISRSAAGAFEVGRNLAVTPGAVVHENAVAQLIQYRPRTPLVRARPLLIVPPFINRYYILDLQPHDSFVRFALEQGLQVFLVSWRNPGPAQARFGWDDYVRHGVLEMLDATLDIGGAQQCNTLGFCVGGTLLATALAVMPRRQRVASLTLLASLLDFADPGEIAVYIDRAYVEQCERDYAHGGIVPGAQIAAAFASLRANELVWRFVVNNYLKGRTPPAFDLLAWNADSTNVPGPLYAWYLRNLYLENRLREPGGIRVLDQGVDLRRLRMPAYVMAARDDHIVPWTSAFASAQRLAGRIDFVLGASGHVAGVVNPPAAGRRHYWTGGSADSDAQAWLAQAAWHEGSWWSHWSAWIRPRSGRLVPARSSLGSAQHAVVEPAPGRYVREPCTPAEIIKP
jgi:polyhydroxyalkanoate synthase